MTLRAGCWGGWVLCRRGVYIAVLAVLGWCCGATTLLRGGQSWKQTLDDFCYDYLRAIARIEFEVVERWTLRTGPSGPNEPDPIVVRSRYVICYWPFAKGLLIRYTFRENRPPLLILQNPRHAAHLLAVGPAKWVLQGGTERPVWTPPGYPDFRALLVQTPMLVLLSPIAAEAVPLQQALRDPSFAVAGQRMEDSGLVSAEVTCKRPVPQFFARRTRHWRVLLDPERRCALRRMSCWEEVRVRGGVRALDKSQVIVEYGALGPPHPTRYRSHQTLVQIRGERRQLVQELLVDCSIRRLGPCRHDEDVFYLAYYGIDESAVHRYSLSFRRLRLLGAGTVVLVLLALLGVWGLRRARRQLLQR